MKHDAEEFEKTMAEQPDLSGITNSVESIASALADADEKSKDFLKSMEEIKDAQHTIAENADALVSALEHQKDVEVAIAKAKKEQAAAELELMKAKGQITPEQYDRAKIQLESQSAREAAQRDVDYLEKEKQAEETARDTARHNVEELGKREQAAQQRAAAADNNLKQAEQRRTHAKTEMDKVTEEITGTKDAPGLQEKVDTFRSKMYPQLDGMTDAELRSYFDKLKGAGSNLTWEEQDSRGQIEKYFDLTDKLSNARRQQSGFAGKMRDSDGAIESAKAEKSGADTALAELNKQIRDNAESVKTLSAKIDQLTRSLDAHKDDARVFEAQDRARRAAALPSLEKDLGVTNDQGAAAYIQKYLASITNLNQGHGTESDREVVQGFVALKQATQESDRRLFLLLQDLILHKGNLNESLADLASQLKNNPSMRGSPTGQ
jgi:chromosome segregation ATPase